MTLFYGSRDMAMSATQKFTSFNYGALSLFRIPSTFVFVAQYLNFLLIALIPALTSVSLSNTKKEKIGITQQEYKIKLLKQSMLFPYQEALKVNGQFSFFNVEVIKYNVSGSRSFN